MNIALHCDLPPARLALLELLGARPVVGCEAQLVVVGQPVGRRHPVAQPAVDEVLEDDARRLGLVDAAALVEEGVHQPMSHQQLLRARERLGVVGLGAQGQLACIRALELAARHAADQLVHGVGVVSDLVNRKYAVAVHLRLGARQRGEDQPGAVADRQVGLVRAGERLEVLRLARRGGDGHLLVGDERVDRARLAHVGVAHEAHVELVHAVVGRAARDHGDAIVVEAVALRAQAQQQREKLVAAVHVLGRQRLARGVARGRSEGVGLYLGLGARDYGLLRLEGGLVRALLHQRAQCGGVLALLRLEVLRGRERREEGEAHALLGEEVRPALAHRLGQQVGLVEQQ
mmetsp:Transcript_21226/g.53800  ORF Transcript_21226/g.53800 Transcript_21226/m.53800 type:complete len:346 (-) Transcript_21226:885-1922(-)